ncbi:hypothetical protein HanPSC8_Chr16g0695221 [Helianthus annuus]|nr:hypothetical protein HanIR_Chr16g0788711 [Helianthus annuus]KAJ0819365.1 hypothetical protein HanPSC8_Chr16g0695221 [Helianthus annuus]
MFLLIHVYLYGSFIYPYFSHLPVLSLDIITFFSLLFSRQLCRSHGGDSRERNREQVG